MPKERFSEAEKREVLELTARFYVSNPTVWGNIFWQRLASSKRVKKFLSIKSVFWFYKRKLFFSTLEAGLGKVSRIVLPTFLPTSPSCFFRTFPSPVP